MLNGSVKGRAELRHVQGLITTSPQRLQQDLAVGVRNVVRQIPAEVKAETATLPKRGGYAALLAAAIRTTTRVTTGAVIKAAVTVSAQGRREQRDVSSVNLGRLRHPVWGNRKVWATTRVLPGFVTRPIDRARDRIVDVARDARDELANRIVRG